MDVGGLESVVIGLVHAGRDFDVAPYLGCLYGLGAQGADIVADGVWSGDLGAVGFCRTSVSLARYLRQQKIDVVHTHNPQPHLVGVLAAALARLPVVHTKHGRNYPGNVKRVWLNRQLSRFTKRVVAVSEAAARVAREVERVPTAKVMVIRNGIDTELFRRGELAAQEDGADRPITIGAVGRLSKEKNYPMLVRAFASLASQASESMPPFQLLFVGDGPERPVIEAEAKECGVLDQCEFAGMQNNVADWLRKMDIFSLSSITEGTSMTLLEAGATGLPSVVTDVGGNGEIVVDGDTGFVVSAEAEPAFAAALMKLAENEGLRKQMGAGARARILDLYSRQSMMSQYVGVYEHAVHGR